MCGVDGLLGVNARNAIKASKHARVTKQQLRNMEVQIVRVIVRKHKLAAPGARPFGPNATRTKIRGVVVIGTHVSKQSAKARD